MIGNREFKMGKIIKLYESEWLHFSLSFVLGVLFICFRYDVIRVGSLQNFLQYMMFAIWAINQVFWILNDYCPRFANLIGIVTGLLVMFGAVKLLHL
jgi:uncharacterized membrane protein YjjP (DUF1212 family)